MEHTTDAAGGGAGADCQLLIDCLRKVEVGCINFLQESDGRFLIENVKKMYSQPKEAISDLREKFGSIVDPVLLERFQGTWMAFLLWNDFSKTFQILYNYPSEVKNVDRVRYEFVGRFVSSPQFESSGFSEPMTDLLFSDKTERKKVMVFSWQEQSAKPPAVSEHIKPVMLEFGGLREARWAEDFSAMDKFVEDHQTDEDKDDENFAALATLISDLASRILRDEEFGVKMFDRAMTTINEELGVKQSGKAAATINEGLTAEASASALVRKEALCRSLIWNRLLDKDWNYLYYIPAKFLEGSAVSGVVCAFENHLNVHEYVILTQIVNRVFSLIQFGFYLQHMGMFALRSATAAIMARNKSHIHGSHIEHGLRNKMSSFEDIVAARLFGHQPFYNSLREQLNLS
jgi:hypothetical protein